MSKYENRKYVDLQDIAKSRGLKLWSQLRMADMMPCIRENDKIDQTQCKEHVERQRLEIDRRYRDEMKQKTREEFERNLILCKYNAFYFSEIQGWPKKRSPPSKWLQMATNNGYK